MTYCYDKLLDQCNQNILFSNDIIITAESHSSQQLKEQFDIIPGNTMTSHANINIHKHQPHLVGLECL